MPCHYPFPKATAIASVLSDLLGREVKVVPSAPMQLERDTPAVVSDYVDDQSTTAVVCVTDLRLSNSLGAALTMVPASAVDVAVQKWQIEEANLENLNEIVNIMARLFNHDDCVHLRWRSAIAVPASIPDEVAALMSAPMARRDFEVDVEEYGVGTMTVMVA